jgi:hypothetical protein
VNWKSPKLWISVFSLLAVSAVALVDARRTSPGPIAVVHARLDDFDGGDSCAQCHGGWFSNLTNSCLECHDVVKEQIDARHGIHGIPATELAQNCGECHGDHHGATFALVNDSAFKRIGAKNEAEFDHNLVGFDMNGRHAEIACSECHEHAKADVLAEGTKRYQGLAQDCGSCHEDPHEGRMQVACAACHGQSRWDEHFSLGHEKFLPLVGGHGDVGCRACHAEKEPHSLESLGNRGPRPAARDCIACHMSPHTSTFANGAAALAQLSLGQSCVVCHEAAHTIFREPSLKITAEQHALSGYPLDAPHDKPTCADCHDPRQSEFRARYPGREKEACSVCHADPHGGQFAAGPFANQQCTVCHDRAHWTPNTFSPEQHALSALTLDGAHAKTECHECHVVPAPEMPRLFEGTDATCEACHLDAHGGFFEDTLPADQVPEHGTCEACHTTTKFADLPEGGFDHEGFTDFAIRGAHAESDCQSCHPTAKAPDASGRTFGRVEEHFGKFAGCVTCHDDPHLGRFDSAQLPAEVDGRTDCARCHEESSFRALKDGFDHGRWTGFDLVGAHALDCAACHEPLRVPDKVGRTWQAAMGAKCSDCHVDPHAGQFDARGANRCEQCHTDATTSFLSFNHDRDSRFPLREQHAEVSCAACHKAQTSPAGDEVVRYRPLGIECVDCHGVHEDVLMQRKRRRK